LNRSVFHRPVLFLHLRMIFQLLQNDIRFPNPALAEEDGLLAVGGDLSAERLMEAYAKGIFPWFSEGDPLLWYAPHERCVIYPHSIKISKSMKQVLRSNRFTITTNTAFADVIKNCANTPRHDQDGTWITNEMQEAYINLHSKGVAHSVEVWSDGLLVGGLYGITVGKVFCGESMFSLQSNASKTALIWLCQQGFYELIDCQLPNEHLLSLGAVMLDSESYRNILH